jgi:hypothetical protein
MKSKPTISRSTVGSAAYTGTPSGTRDVKRASLCGATRSDSMGKTALQKPLGQKRALGDEQALVAQVTLAQVAVGPDARVVQRENRNCKRHKVVRPKYLHPTSSWRNK